MKLDYACDKPKVLIHISRQRWLVGLSALLLCSCQAMQPHTGQPNGNVGMLQPTGTSAAVTTSQPSRQVPQVIPVAQYDARMVAYEAPVAGYHPQTMAASGMAVGPYYPPALPAQAWTGVPMPSPSCCPPGTSSCGSGTQGGCAPPEGGPYPPEEYICDGGDRPSSVSVANDWTVYGLDPEDTVVHYDTRQGDTRVQPSNRVCIYAPRFAAVRRVSSVLQHEQHQRGAEYEMPLAPGLSGTAELATTMLQPVQLKGERSVKFGQTFRERTRTVGLENAQMAAATEETLLPFEDFLIVREGQFDNTEKARLSTHLDAAVTWTHEKAVQVVVDNIVAVEAANEVETDSVFTYELPVGKPRVRVVKIASRQDAQPGELIEFTLRFDNVGDDVIGNVTVIDNLTKRLEYVPDRQTCSLEADFVEEENEVESLTLRWEITKPLKVGEGGVIRFQCRVR